MPNFFSKRTRPKPTSYRYDLPEVARRRILHSIIDLQDSFSNSFDPRRCLAEVGTILMKEYGGLHAPRFEAARVSDDPVIQHFFSCDNILALDFVEALFYPFINPGQQGVEIINEILDGEAIGYQLTPYIEHITEKKGSIFGRSAGNIVDTQRPQIIKKESELLHQEVVQPTINLLKDARFKGASEEFLKAHVHYRHQDYQSCLNECLKAFESSMKIICHHKKWPYNQTDTSKTLIHKCIDQGLITSSSQQQLTSLRTLFESGVPTLRNKQGGHGQGVQQNDVPAEIARYALNLTASTILLFVESAKL